MLSLNLLSLIMNINILNNKYYMVAAGMKKKKKTFKGLKNENNI